MRRTHVLRRFLSGIVLVALVAVVGSRYSSSGHLSSVRASRSQVAETKPPDVVPVLSPPPCYGLNGAENVFLVMKTGVTEAEAKLPVHFNTTFRCASDFIIYSDHAQVIEGHQLHDALDKIDDHIRQTHSDFELYRELKETKNTDQSNLKSKVVIKEDSPGWKLDKWKFMPILEKALHERPDSPWYVFIEADTYLVWTNLVQWLSTLDHTQPWYIGNQMLNQGRVFAHGGAGYILSNSALRRAVAVINQDRKRFDELMLTTCCGDLGTAIVLSEAKVDFFGAWPMLLVDTPSTEPFEWTRWYQPVVSQHHMSRREVEASWNFEQDFISLYGSKRIMTHMDVFERFIEPAIEKPLPGWDNLSSDENFAHDDTDEEHNVMFERCKTRCENHSTCMQYSVNSTMCQIGYNIQLGHQVDMRESDEQISSGWMTKRIEKMKIALKRSPQWLTTEDYAMLERRRIGNKYEYFV